MKLLLDIGNSSVNWASEKESRFLSQGSFMYNKNNFENSLPKNFTYYAMGHFENYGEITSAADRGQ